LSRRVAEVEEVEGLEEEVDALRRALKDFKTALRTSDDSYPQRMRP
jgi:hypothetical protein